MFHLKKKKKNNTPTCFAAPFFVLPVFFPKTMVPSFEKWRNLRVSPPTFNAASTRLMTSKRTRKNLWVYFICINIYIIYIYIYIQYVHGTQMTPVLIGKDPVLEG